MKEVNVKEYHFTNKEMADKLGIKGKIEFLWIASFEDRIEVRTK